MRLALWALAYQDDVLLGTKCSQTMVALMHKRMEHTVPSVSGTVHALTRPWLVDFSLTMATQQKVRHLIQVHNLLILSKLGIHCGKPSVDLILDFLLEVSIKSYSI